MDGNQTTLLSLNGQNSNTNLGKRSNSSNVENKLSSLIFSSRSPSPETSVGTNGGSTNQPKPNQVSTVLLYGIPIVSLYIEAQERLCLAQISNTLLKQFSYNEIHNRRVALGITCVQCTPVQLEILRRAGAMPVSSRRCGMITRREAERLCKSFLGDNSPPRLPDDFSFGVFHECAWGCRGAFMPSRYNSSRAKCIKCTYCGLFFSPNKFIFHSHRLSPNDKYVQPDAANFNSWRRHLRLSGTPLEEVQHAWEDVKAMFNGGTRKRIMSSPLSPIQHQNSSHNTSSSSSAKRVKENPPNPPLAIAAAITQFPLRPIIHSTPTPQPQPQSPESNSSPISSANTTVTNTPSVRHPPQAAVPFPQELPFSISRSFMIDYMWHHHHQQQNQTNSPTGSIAPPSAAKTTQFQFPPYSALSWIKQPPSSFLFKPNSAGNDDKPAFNHFSAFKPVINMRVDSIDTSAPTSVVSCNANQSQSPSSSTSSYNHTTTSSNNQSDNEETFTSPTKQDHRKKYQRFGNQHQHNPSQKDPNYIDVEDDDDSNHNDKVSSECDNSFKEQMISDDENEVVDIETTEDDVHIHDLQPYKRINDYEEQIQVIDDKNSDVENNNSVISEESVERSLKHRITIKKSTKVDNENDYQHKRAITGARKSPFNNNNNNDWTINLKKEPLKLDISTTESVTSKHKTLQLNVEEKPNGTLSNMLSTFTSPNGDDHIPLIPVTTASSNELWSVARLSLECNNTRDDHIRNSFYHHLNQIQQRNTNNNSTQFHPLHHLSHDAAAESHHPSHTSSIV